MAVGAMTGLVLIGAVGLGTGALVPLFVRPWCSCPRNTWALTAMVCSTIFVAMAHHFDDAITAVAYCISSLGLLMSTTIDIGTHRLPREISYATLALGAPLLFLAAHITAEDHRIRSALLGALLALVVIGFFYTVSRGGLGDGDVRFSPLLGVYTGWSSLHDVVDGLFLGFATGAVWGLSLMILGRAGRKTALPFGPFLALGAVLAVLLPGRLVLVP